MTVANSCVDACSWPIAASAHRGRTAAVKGFRTPLRTGSSEASLSCSSWTELESSILQEALWGNLSWPERRELDRLLPERLTIPSGRAARLLYGEEEVTLAVKLQKCLVAPRDLSCLTATCPSPWSSSPQLAAPCNEPVICGDSGMAATAMFAGKCVAAIPSTPGQNHP